METKGKTLVELFNEEREIINKNMLAIQFLVERSQRAKESAILLTTKDAKTIHDLAEEVIKRFGF
jgi:hypothetical protein